MTTTAASTQPVRFFIHDDFDAFRMEIAGSLAGRAAQQAYEAWRDARLLADRARLVVDISYVTEADEYGEAVLQAWRKQEVQIVASSAASRAIANSILRTPGDLPEARRTIADRLRSFFCRPAAGNLARAESKGVLSAGSKQEDAQNTGFPLLSGAEQRVR